MMLIFPLELSFHVKLNFKTASGQGLGVCIKLDSGHVMDEFMQDFTKLGEFG
jgi:hypothetical protein